MTTRSPAILNASQTAAVLPYPELVAQLIKTAREKAAGAITTPPRQALEYPHGGTLLSMPATAHDIGAHKLVNVMPQNAATGEAVIQGLVCAYDGLSGAPLFILDGPTVTERRTAAVSMMGIELLWGSPREVTVIGSGIQAQGHIAALLSLYPEIHINVLARNPDKAKLLLQNVESAKTIQIVEQVPSSCDVVITVTSSSTPVYNEAADAQRLVIGVGAYRSDMAEIHPHTIQASQLFVDNADAAEHEAGDYIQAKVNWALVTPIIAAQAELKGTAPLVYKTIGCAAWDLAAARCARLHL